MKRAAAAGGAVAGLLFVAALGSRFTSPAPLDPAVWNVTSVGEREKVVTPGLGRGTHVVDGALLIRQHVFRRADVVSPVDTRPVARIELAMVEGSGVARVLLKGDGRRPPVEVELTPDAYLAVTAGGAPTSRDDAGPWAIEVRDGRVVLVQAAGPVPLGRVGPGTFDLTAESGEVAFAAIRAVGEDGVVVVDADFTTVRPSAFSFVVGALAGAIAGLLLRVVALRGVSRAEGVFAAALLALPTLFVGLVPPYGWLLLVERFYLVRTPAWDLAAWALAASFVPLGVAAALRGGVLAPVPAGHADDRAWVGAAVVAALLASRGLEGWQWLLFVPGLAFAALPIRVARLGGLDRRRSLLVDAPALIALAALGWKGGAWLAVGWRAVVLAASARTLLDRAPRAAADLLSVLLLTAPVSCEMAARATYLKKAWDAERLVADSAPATGWRDPEPFWSGTCGPPAARESHGVLFAGGSSTGGAYQFVDEPEAFFPTQAHERLCAALPEVAFTATNFGGGGRDTFTISRTIERLMERAGNPDVVVLYTGVNDLAGTTNPKTRKQREADEAARGEAVAGAVSLATRSRVLTGLSLWSRSRGEARAASVPEVPLPDAEENLRRVAAATAARGAQLLLVTEFATVQADPTLLPYARMEARLAEELDGVEYFDVRAALAGVPETELLIDQNHLTREGAARVGAELATVIARMLGYP